MSRRASLPGADELFRPTAGAVTTEPVVEKSEPASVAKPAPTPAEQSGPPAGTDPKTPKHEEKITFYCRLEDVTRLEKARLTLRSDHRLSSDRGRIVRAALAEILEDFEARGSNSSLVRRLQAGK
ncbi:MAG: hypothetical protein ACRDIU_07580 [Actinomycetota bacterium]